MLRTPTSIKPNKTLESPVKEKYNLFKKENRDVIFILILFAIGAGLSLYIQMLIKYYKDSEEMESKKPFITQLIVLKIILVGTRLFVSKGLGGTSSSFNMFTNLLTIILLNGGAHIKSIETSFNTILRIIGRTVSLELYDFLIKIQYIDFWIHIIGMSNTIAPLPGIINKILSLAIIITQFPTTQSTTSSF